MEGGTLGVVADELAIRNLVARMAHLVDEGEFDEYSELLAENAVIEAGNGTRNGRAHILQVARERRASGTSGNGESRHLVTTTWVQVVQEKTSARAASCFLFVRNTTTHPTVEHVGRYHDEFACSRGMWRLVRRRILVG
jgi:3-phenylpropionate/cinnamic acid dioxygenase small subunit